MAIVRPAELPDEPAPAATDRIILDRLGAPMRSADVTTLFRTGPLASDSDQGLMPAEDKVKVDALGTASTKAAGSAAGNLPILDTNAMLPAPFLSGRRLLPASIGDNPATNCTAQVQAWIDGTPDRGYVDLGSRSLLIDGIDVNGRQGLTIQCDGTLEWSGTPRGIVDSTTGIAYPPALILTRGYFVGSRYCRFEIADIDGFNLGCHGVYEASGYNHRWNVGRVHFCDIGFNIDVHETNAGDQRVEIETGEFCRGIVRVASDTLYAANPAKYLYVDPTHHAEGLDLRIGFAAYYKDFGFRKEQRVQVNDGGTIRKGGTLNSTNLRGFFDAYAYYRYIGVDPMNPMVGADPYNPTPPSNWFGGSTPIQNAFGYDAPRSGRTRPAGCLTKSSSADGALDIIDLYDTVDTTSKSVYQLTWHGNSLAKLQAVSPGLTRSQVVSPHEGKSYFYGILLDGETGEITLKPPGSPYLFNINPATGRVTSLNGTIRLNDGLFDRLILDGNGAKFANGLSMFGATPPAVKPVISGSRGSSLASLASIVQAMLTAGANIGEWQDNTTA